MSFHHNRVLLHTNDSGCVYHWRCIRDWKPWTPSHLGDFHTVNGNGSNTSISASVTCRLCKLQASVSFTKILELHKGSHTVHTLDSNLIVCLISSVLLHWIAKAKQPPIRTCSAAHRPLRKTINGQHWLTVIHLYVHWSHMTDHWVGVEHYIFLD